MNVLADKLDALCGFLQARFQPPDWRGIRIFEVGTSLDDQNRLRVSINDLFSPEDFDERFNELFERGLPWINLSCYGLYNGFLIVGVEIPQSTTTAGTNTSVNYAGPPMAVLQREWDATGILAIN